MFDILHALSIATQCVFFTVFVGIQNITQADCFSTTAGTHKRADVFRFHSFQIVNVPLYKRTKYKKELFRRCWRAKIALQVLSCN
jgi:hypothetical protein